MPPLGTSLLLLCLLRPIAPFHFEDDDGQGSLQPIDGPRLVPGQWTPCSASCGPGVQSRAVECRAPHLYAGYRILPAEQCRGQPPLSAVQPCFVQPCPLQQEQPSSTREEHHWRHARWSPCSASCLGGKQRAHLQCIHVATGASVDWVQCDGRLRPPEKIQSCNEIPCPPEWVSSEWGPCPSDCGSRSRVVRCVRASAEKGGSRTQIVVEERLCHGPRPIDNAPCGHCHGWKIGNWSECSTTCGTGEQRRSVDCSLPTSCPHPSPHSIQGCNSKPCEEAMEEKNAPMGDKKLTMDIGGVATLFQGTSIKVKCPRKNADKKKITWTKDSKKIDNNAHIKVSANGNLRITHARMEDAGLYECRADGKARGNVTILFKLRSSEEEGTPSALPRPSGKKGKKERAKYKGGAWGECLQSNCELGGIQERKVECFVSEGRSHRAVSLSICQSLRVPNIAHSRHCTRQDCAHWNASAWTPCGSSACIRKWMGEQTRLVSCYSGKGSRVEDSQCSSSTRPPTTAHCANPGCVAEWRANDWGECSASCGTGGVQLRILHCVWANSGKPAGRACDGIQEPRTTRACARTAPLPPCTPRSTEESLREGCMDLSRFCDIIKLFHSCESSQVRERCCATCTRVEQKRLRLL